LDALALEILRAPGEIQEEDQVQNKGRSEDGVATQEVELDLHRITEPPEEVDIVPALLVVTPRRIIVNANLVIKILEEFRIQIRLKNVFQHGEL